MGNSTNVLTNWKLEFIWKTKVAASCIKTCEIQDKNLAKGMRRDRRMARRQKLPLFCLFARRETLTASSLRSSSPRRALWSLLSTVYIIGWASNTLLDTVQQNVPSVCAQPYSEGCSCVCEGDTDQTFGSIWTKFWTQVFGRKLSVEFVTGTIA